MCKVLGKKRTIAKVTGRVKEREGKKISAGGGVRVIGQEQCVREQSWTWE